jgi:hypothetical protein
LTFLQGSIINKDAKGPAQLRKDFKAVQGIIRKTSLGNSFFKGDSPTEAPKETPEKESTIAEETQEPKPKAGTNCKKCPVSNIS